MGITPRFNQNDINRQLQAAKKQIDDRIIGILKYTGEMSIKVAREDGAYRDQTGNLRSSIGYVIYANGDKVAETFELAIITGKIKNDKKALYIARAYASGIAEKWSGDNDYVLVVVAGMNYASSVESRGLNVLITAQQYAESALPRLITMLNTKLK